MAEFKITRPEFTFKIPEKVRQYDTDPVSLTLRPITAEEEARALEATGGKSTQLGAELTRMSVCKVDGKVVNWNSADPEWLERSNPKVRELAYAAFKKVNQPVEAEIAGFLGSMTQEQTG